MWVVRTLLILLLVLLVVAFAFNNFSSNQTVDVKLEPLFANYVDVPLVTVVFWSFASGCLLSFLLFVSIFIKQSLQNHSSKKRVKQLESEVTILRNRPIEESAELLKGADSLLEKIESPFSKPEGDQL